MLCARRRTSAGEKKVFSASAISLQGVLPGRRPRAATSPVDIPRYGDRICHQMPRAERLFQLTELLRGRDVTTVADLSEELRVSRRTLLRDLAALRERGLPISGEAGRGGGVRLEGARGVAAVHLSLSEVVSIWIAARLSRAASELPWGEAASSGMDKLLSSLPTAKARALRALCRRVVVGCPASAQIRAGAGPCPPELLSLFEQAFSAGIGLGFRYTDREADHAAPYRAAWAAGADPRLVRARARRRQGRAAHVSHGSHRAAAHLAGGHLSSGSPDPASAAAGAPGLAPLDGAVDVLTAGARGSAPALRDPRIMAGPRASESRWI